MHDFGLRREHGFLKKYISSTGPLADRSLVVVVVVVVIVVGVVIVVVVIVVVIVVVVVVVVGSRWLVLGSW